MPLSLHIAQGSTRRLAGRKGPAKLRARVSVGGALRLGLFSPNTERSDKYMNRAGRCVTISRRLKNNPSRVTDNEKFRLKLYHFSSSF
jgi:hypothetical protein